MNYIKLPNMDSEVSVIASWPQATADECQRMLTRLTTK